MRSIRLILFVVCVAQLAGCAGFWNSKWSADADGNVVQPAFVPAPYPNYYPTYTAPQVATPQVGNSSPTSNYICNTIGYVTTCSEH